MPGEKILIVDDNPFNVKLAEYLLKAEGFDVRHVMAANEVIAAVALWAPSLVLMDLRLPGTGRPRAHPPAAKRPRQPRAGHCCVQRRLRVERDAECARRRMQRLHHEADRHGQTLRRNSQISVARRRARLTVFVPHWTASSHIPFHRRCRSGAAPFDKVLKGDFRMRFMVIVKADRRTEAGVLPTADDLATMGKFNEELVKAGVMVDGAGLKPSSKGARRLVSRRQAEGDRRTVRRNEGAHRRLLDHQREVARGGDRMGEARCRSRSCRRGPRAGTRDPAVLRARRLPGGAGVGRGDGTAWREKK